MTFLSLFLFFLKTKAISDICLKEIAPFKIEVSFFLCVWKLEYTCMHKHIYMCTHTHWVSHIHTGVYMHTQREIFIYITPEYTLCLTEIPIPDITTFHSHFNTTLQTQPQEAIVNLHLHHTPLLKCVGTLEMLLLKRYLNVFVSSSPKSKCPWTQFYIIEDITLLHLHLRFQPSCWFTWMTDDVCEKKN